MADHGDRIDVPGGLYWQSRFFRATRGLWRSLGNLETRVVAEETEGLRVNQPIYVTSLARAGTTIVTEMLERHPALTCHHYSDFPNMWTPYWRNFLLQKSRREPPEATVRAHRDRILVSHDSPEAVEEVLWMAFFEGLHDEAQCNVLDASHKNDDFDQFYTDHILKLLAVRNANRYLAKGNYNISRLAYLHRLFPDAYFVIPVRSPEHHIASLQKQHRLFSRGHELNDRVGEQLAMSGHYEFGPYRRAVHFGNDETSSAIRAAWDEGRDIEGWALYWADTYRFLAEQLNQHPELAQRCILFRYEDLCTHSEDVITALLSHCELDEPAFQDHKAEYSQRLTLPDYYQPDFDTDELDQVKALCDPVMALLEPHIKRP